MAHSFSQRCETALSIFASLPDRSLGGSAERIAPEVPCNQWCMKRDDEEQPC